MPKWSCLFCPTRVTVLWSTPERRDLCKKNDLNDLTAADVAERGQTTEENGRIIHTLDDDEDIDVVQTPVGTEDGVETRVEGSGKLWIRLKRWSHAPRRYIRMPKKLNCSLGAIMAFVRF